MSPRLKQCAEALLRSMFEIVSTCDLRTDAADSNACEDAFVANLRLQTDIDSLIQEMMQLRKQHGTLRLARKLGISDQYVRDLCSGKRRPGIRLIRRIAGMN